MLRRFSPVGGPIKHWRQYICSVFIGYAIADHIGHIPSLPPGTDAVQWLLRDHGAMTDIVELLISTPTINSNTTDLSPLDNVRYNCKQKQRINGCIIV